MLLLVVTVFHLLRPHSALIFLEKFNVSCNKAIIDIKVDFENLESCGVVANITGVTFQVIEKSTLYLTLNIQAHSKDDAFSVPIMKTRIDVEKILKNIYGNFMIKNFMSSIMDHVTALNLTFPVPMVSNCSLL